MFSKLLFHFSILAILISSTLPQTYAEWSEPGIVVPEEVFDDILLSYNPTSQQLFSAWRNLSSGIPHYSLYSPNLGWSSPLPIATSTFVNAEVTLGANPMNGQTFAAWGDVQQDAVIPTYAIYEQSSGWSLPQAITATTSVNHDVNLLFIPSVNQMMAAWVDNANNNCPTYSFYSYGIGWSAPEVIFPTAAAFCDVNLAYNSQSGQVLALWQDREAFYPMFAFYTPNVGCGVPAPISTTSTVKSNIKAIYNLPTQQFLAVWSDLENDYQPTYALFTNNAWGPTALISSSTVLDDVFLVNASTGQTFAAWIDYENNFNPTYAIFNFSTGWSAAAPITTTPQSIGNVSLAYNSAGVFASWPTVESTGLWSFYGLLTPPTSLHAVQQVNKFLTQRQYNIYVNWTKSVALDVVGYNLYRSGVLVAKLNASTLNYIDYSRPKNIPTVYAVTSVDSAGNESYPLSSTSKSD